MQFAQLRPPLIVDWLQSPMTKYFFLIILFDNLLIYNQNNIMTVKAGRVQEPKI